jgi:glyoxylase-like metal-dependent hydrolase (beta-lactamase superfamily II)
MEMRRFALGALWTNGYLVWTEERRGIFIDPGGDVSEVEAWLREKDIVLEAILLTHGHADHIAGVEGLRKGRGIPVAIHLLDAPKLSAATENLSAFMGNPLVCGGAELLLEDGMTLEIAGLSIHVLHTPGHTEGCCCFLVEEQRPLPKGATGLSWPNSQQRKETLLFSGDTLFAQSVGRTDLPGGDEATLLSSLKKLARLPDELRVLPGHGPETTIGRERESNPFWPR